MGIYTGITILAVVTAVAVVGLIMPTGTSIVGALTLQEQAGYEIAMTAYNQCSPELNPFVDSDQARENCCSQACLTPCLTSGIQDCASVCRRVCMGKPIYQGGRK